MFHHIATNECAGSPKTSWRKMERYKKNKSTSVSATKRREEGSRRLTFAVDRNGPLSALTYAEELPDDGVVWSAPVDKEQIVMFEPGLCEALGVVHLLVESDDGSDVIFPKVWDVGLRGVQRVT